MQGWFSILLLIVLGAGFALGSVLLSSLLGRREPTAENLTPHECAMPATGDAHTRQSVTFYVVAMIVLLFDIAVAFLVPWAMAARDLGWNGFVQVVLFAALLSFGYLYVWCRGAFSPMVAVLQSAPGDPDGPPASEEHRLVLSLMTPASRYRFVLLSCCRQHRERAARRDASKSRPQRAVGARASSCTSRASSCCRGRVSWPPCRSSCTPAPSSSFISLCFMLLDLPKSRLRAALRRALAVRRGRGRRLRGARLVRQCARAASV